MPKYLIHCSVFWLQRPIDDLLLVISPPPFIKVSGIARSCSKIGKNNFEWKRVREGGQYYISQTCVYQRFEARKVVFSSECLNIFAIGCSFKASSPYGGYREKAHPSTSESRRLDTNSFLGFSPTHT